METSNVSVGSVNITLSDFDTASMVAEHYYLAVMSYGHASAVMARLVDASTVDEAYGLSNDILEYVITKAGYTEANCEVSVFKVVSNDDDGLYTMIIAGVDLEVLQRKLDFAKRDVSSVELNDDIDFVTIDQYSYGISKRFDFNNVETNAYYVALVDESSTDVVLALLMNIQDDDTALESASVLYEYLYHVCGYIDDQASLVRLLTNGEDFTYNHLSGVDMRTLYNDYLNN